MKKYLEMNTRQSTNEISQISYTGHSLLKTRLNPPKGVKPIMLLDQNPSHKRHWGYKIFHQGINPVDDTPIADMARYGLLKMNPADNLENISETYMDTLLTLSEQERKRFIDGEYTDIVGAIYNRFNDSMVITSLKPCDYYVVGVDLITYAAVLVGFLSNDVIVLDELGGHDLTAAELNKLIVAEWGKYRYKAYIDWNLSETGTREFDNSSLAIKGAGSVEAGINQIKQLMESKHFWIHEKCIRTRTDEGLIGGMITARLQKSQIISSTHYAIAYTVTTGAVRYHRVNLYGLLLIIAIRSIKYKIKAVNYLTT